MTVPKLRFKEFDGDWNSIAIGSLLKIKSGLGFKAEEYTTEEAIRLLQIENVGYGTVKWTHNVKYVPHDYLSIHPELVLKENDIVLALNRPVTNDQLKIAKLTNEDSPSILYQRVGKLEFKENEIDHNFIFQIFQKEVKSYVLNSSIGSDQPFISTTDLYKHKIILPYQKEQTKIASFLSAVDEKISQLSQKLHLLGQYKQGMMQKLFSQQLRFKADDGNEFREWSNKTIGDVANIKRGASPRPINDSKWFDDSSSIGWVRISDVSKSKKYLLQTEQYLSTLGIQKSRLVPKGNLIMSICATIGKPIYTGFDVCIHDGFVVFSELQAIHEYAYYYLEYIEKNWYQYGQPGTQVNLNSDIVSNEAFPFPCLEEQTKIANFLSAIDQKIDVVSEQLEQAKLWKKGLLQQMFV